MGEEVPDQEDAQSDLKNQECCGEKPVFLAVFWFIVIVIKHLCAGLVESKIDENMKVIELKKSKTLQFQNFFHIQNLNRVGISVLNGDWGIYIEFKGVKYVTY